MRKPLIVLVDDDRPVLEALEAALAPAFEEVCRIETFDDPREALAAVPGWAEQRRPIAVAVVDQRMPHLTGVELLVRLKRLAGNGGNGHAPSTAYMRSILLTGYAGLESALASKNEAAVDRYLEKPWNPEELLSTVRRLLMAHLDESGWSSFLRLGHVATADALVDVFRLRYRVYRMGRSPLGGVRANADGAVLDGHDRSSVILGLWRSTEGESELVGTLRLVTRDASPFLDEMREAALRLPAAGGALEEETASSFPFVERFPDRETIESFIEGIEIGGGRVAEIGRQAVLPKERSEGADRRQIEGAAAIFPLHGLTHAFADVPPARERHYRSLGFQQVTGARSLEGDFPGTPVWSAVDRMRPPVADRVPTLTKRLTESRPDRAAFLCFCPSYPDCLPWAYLTGNFRQTDLYCPLGTSRGAPDVEAPPRDEDRGEDA